MHNIYFELTIFFCHHDDDDVSLVEIKGQQ